MSYKFIPLAVICIILGACSQREIPNSQRPGMLGSPVAHFGNTVRDIDTGLYMPNSEGGTYFLKGVDRKNPNQVSEEAYELKLRARELGAQLLDTRNNSALRGLVAMPTSFINLDDFSESTSFGRYLGEAMFYEFNQRDFPVREYRLTGKIAMASGPLGGEFSISRNLAPVSTNQAWAAVLIGTYQRNGAAIFVNARLVRPSDGMVLRTAQLVLPINHLLAEMTTKPKKPLFETVSTKMVGRR